MTDLDLLKAIMAAFRQTSPLGKISDPTVLQIESKGFNTITSMSIYTPPYLHEFACPQETLISASNIYVCKRIALITEDRWMLLATTDDDICKQHHDCHGQRSAKKAYDMQT
jgi:hypothetical protein